jgi:hypothetical protein
MRQRCVVLFGVGFLSACGGRDGPTAPIEPPPFTAALAPTPGTVPEQTNYADVVLQDLIQRLGPALGPSGAPLLRALQAAARLPEHARTSAIVAAEPLLHALEQSAPPEARPDVDAIRLAFASLTAPGTAE